MDFVDAVEPLNDGEVRNSEKSVEATNFGVLVWGPFIEGDAVPVPAFNHEGSRHHGIGRLTVVEAAAEIGLVHLVLDGEHEAIP